MYWVGKTLAAVLISFFLGGIFLCIGMSATAHAGMQPSDMRCMHAPNDTGCSPSFDHASYWGHFLSALPSDLLGVIAAFLTACASLWLVRRIGWDVMPERYPGFLSDPPPLSLLPRHSLQEAFSNGILNPKLY